MMLRTLGPLALCAAGLLAAPTALAQACGATPTVIGQILPETVGAATVGSNGSIGANGLRGQVFTAPCTGVWESFVLPIRNGNGTPISVSSFIFRGSVNAIPDEATALADVEVLASSPYTLYSFVIPGGLSVTAGETVNFVVAAPSTVSSSSVQAAAVFLTPELEGNYLFSSDGVSKPLGTGASFRTLTTNDSQYRASFSDGSGGGDDPAVTGSLAYGTCPAALPLGRSACRVDASGTFDLDQAQRYTVFLRVQETGRIAKRGEIKPSPTGTASQAIKFSTTAADPASFTLELVAEAGSVAAPSGAAVVIGTLAFTKGDAGLRASEALTAFPNPATDQATLRFAVTESQAATLAIYDALGREVARPVDGQVSGAVEASFDDGGPAGGAVRGAPGDGTGHRDGAADRGALTRPFG